MLTYLPGPQTPLGIWLTLAAGTLVAGIGTALYASADLGTGPRDSLMIGLTRRLRLPVAVVKNGLDLTVALVGWRLGGPLGVGTLAVALTMGPSVQFGFALVARLARVGPFGAFVRPVALRSAPATEPGPSDQPLPSGGPPHHTSAGKSTETRSCPGRCPGACRSRRPRPASQPATSTPRRR